MQIVEILQISNGDVDVFCADADVEAGKGVSASRRALNSPEFLTAFIALALAMQSACL